MTIIKPKRYTAQIVGKQYLNVGQRFLSLRLEVESEEPLHYYAGQYLTILLDGDDERRSYSIANIPDGSNIVELVIEIIPDGKCAQYIVAAAIGDTVDIIAPFGRFVIPQTSTTEQMLFVATGSGIVPVKAMIEHALFLRSTASTIYLVWGMRYEEDLFWIDMFNEWQHRFSNFVVLYSLSRPSEEWKGMEGRVTMHLDTVPINASTDVFICGNKQVIHDVRERVVQFGAEKKHIHTEQFS